jgi:hypothetical protein
MDIKPTVSEILQEGQFKEAYFPEVTNLTTFTQAKINAVDALVKHKTGSNYTSADADIQSLLHTCEFNLTMASMWNAVINTMLTYEQDVLDQDYVDPEACAAQRDFYKEEGMGLLTQFTEDKKTPGAFVGAFRAGAEETDIVGILGMNF